LANLGLKGNYEKNFSRARSLEPKVDSLIASDELLSIKPSCFAPFLALPNSPPLSGEAAIQDSLYGAAP
jgi:hypothetical protein